jgi:uracil-DNA glycosylase
VTSIDPKEVARLLRQRAEMGHGDVFLEEMDRSGALSAARRVQPSQRPVSADNVDAKAAAAAASSPSRAAEPRSASDRGAAPPFATQRGAPPARGNASPAAGAPLPVLSQDLEELRALAAACARCRLGSGRTQAVFADGNPNARLMVVGEAPGQQEDLTGLPFVGPAGKLLDLMLASIGLSRRDSVYIANVVKCRPPGNRNPERDEIEACSPFLKKQIEIVKPEVLLAVGTFSAQLLTGTDKPIGKLRGSVYSYEGVPLVITYHPAALLRNPGWSRATWDDLQLLRQIMDGK